MTANPDVPQGTVYNFTIESGDSKFYSGIAKDPPAPGSPPPVYGAPTTYSAHPAPYTRKVAVYVPKQYVQGTVAAGDRWCGRPGPRVVYCAGQSDCAATACP